MSLSEKLTAVSNKEKKQSLCKLGQMMVGNTLPIEDRDYLIAAVMTPSGDPQRISSAALASVLQEEGHDISATSITHHRLKRCGCFRGGKS
jgi:hypothetical protein